MSNINLNKGNNSHLSGNYDTNIIKSIKHKISQNNLIVTKADKGNSVVILHKDDYDEKVLTFINDNKFKLIKPKLPTFIKNVNDVLKSSTLTIPRNIIYQLSANNTVIPRMYGLLKVHKSNIFSEIPIRPVVSFSNSPTYQLAKWLNSKLKNVINCQFHNTVSNSTQLANKIKNIDIPENAILISLDVTNLFTNIPINEAIQIIKNKLFDSSLSDNESTELVNVLNVCLKQNFFMFNDKVYCQDDGLAMGSPLSPLLADAFMDMFENDHILNNNRFHNHITYYYRYVDDILILWSGSKERLTEFVDYINSIHSKIKFTLELENNKSLNFLDLTIRNVNNKHTFEIYRKPSHTGVIIHESSFHPHTHKLAALNSFVNRAIDIPLNKEAREMEFKIIKQIAKSHNFQTNIIDKLIQKKLLRNWANNAYQSSTNNDITTKYFSMHFNGPISYKIQRLFSRHGITIAFKSRNTLGNFFINNKDKLDPLLNSGVYKLVCECGCTYVGKTKRDFKTRLAEHYRCVRLNNTNSLFAKHILETGHPTNFKTNYKILHVESNQHLINNFEILEILKQMKNNPHRTINSQTNFNDFKLLNIFFNF